jgi:hypothetical protein
MTPVVSFVTFSVYRAMHGELNLPSVFYALSLLHLPKLYLVYFAVIGFQYLTETFVALQRIDKFLGMPEPPPAVHMRARQQAQQPSGAAPPAAAAAVNAAGATAVTATAAVALAAPTAPATEAGVVVADSAQEKQPVNGQQQPACVVAGGSSSGDSSQEGGVVMCDLPDGYVELGGADYDWVTNMQEMASQVRGCSGGQNLYLKLLCYIMPSAIYPLWLALFRQQSVVVCTTVAMSSA